MPEAQYRSSEASPPAAYWRHESSHPPPVNPVDRALWAVESALADDNPEGIAAVTGIELGAVAAPPALRP